jgi:hypothetical protein
MERTYRASNGLYFYIAFLVLDATVLAIEALVRLRSERLPSGVFLAVLALVCAFLAALLFLRWGRLRVVITPETMTVWHGNGPAQHIEWADFERVREMTGPAYQLSLKDLLPGPYLPHGLLQGETVLEVTSHPRQRLVLRRSLVNGFGALRQDVQRSVPKDTDVDLHARWWRD